MKDGPLRRLYLITWISGVAAGVLLLLLLMPWGNLADADSGIVMAALTATGWFLFKVLVVVAGASGLLLIGLSPVASALEEVLAKQDALATAQRENESESTDVPSA